MERFTATKKKFAWGTKTQNKTGNEEHERKEEKYVIVCSTPELRSCCMENVPAEWETRRVSSHHSI